MLLNVDDDYTVFLNNAELKVQKVPFEELEHAPVLCTQQDCTISIKLSSESYTMLSGIIFVAAATDAEAFWKIEVQERFWQSSGC